MKDRFKLRAWDKVRRKYIHNIVFSNINEEITIYERLPSGKTVQLINSHIVLEQCTGLQDKNGTLIYDGDILKIPTSCNQEIHGSYSLNEVVWRNGLWVVSYLSSQTGKKMPKGYSSGPITNLSEWGKEMFFCDNECFRFYKDIEIIGNIHENPELVEEK